MVWKEQESEDSFWKPQKEGEELIGVVVRKFVGEFGNQFDLENKEGLFTTPAHQVLQSKMNKVEVGDKVKLVYLKTDLPKVKGQSGARIYNVFVDKDEEEIIDTETI